MVRVQRGPVRRKRWVNVLVVVALMLLALIFCSKTEYLGDSRAPDADKEPILLQYTAPKRKFERDKFTVDEFIVNGVNLAKYGFEKDLSPEIELTQKYQLFANFDIDEQIEGDEDWWDLVYYHRDLKHKSLIFYMDKVAQKRYMNAVGYPIPKSFVLKYMHELTTSAGGESKEEEKAVLKLLPKKSSYVAKPTHMSSSSGVWLVRYDEETKTESMGYSGEPTEDKFERQSVARQLVKDLHDTAAKFESWALKHAKAGFVVEERFSAFDSDVKAAYEFKTFTIWGRVYIAYLKRGSGPYIGLVKRDGTMLDCKEKNTDWDKLPDWLQWDKVVSLAEQLGRNKDMFRVDIFVGLPAGSRELKGGLETPMSVAVSETEFHPTSSFQQEGILEEAARLWMAGYKMGIHELIPNTEVPAAFLEKGYLSEEDAKVLKPAAAKGVQSSSQ